MRFPLRHLLAMGLLSLSIAAGAATEIRQETVVFPAENKQTTISGRIIGGETVDYLVSARAGETLTVFLQTTHTAAYFNLLPPASETALFIGSMAGERFTGTLPVDGLYKIRVYLMRSAARRNESARYQLSVQKAANGGFAQMLELQGIRFHVTSPQSGSLNTLRVVPAGLEIDNAPIERQIDGTVSGAEVADLNADGSPELYVYVQSAGSGSYGSLAAWSANRRKSLSDIILPPLADTPDATHGYQGHDQFAILEGVLGRRFPLYRDSDPNAKPTGGMRQLQYRLVPGEATWQLKVEKVFDY